MAAVYTTKVCILSVQCSVAIGYDVMKENECLVSSQTSAVTEKEYNVVANSKELTEATEYVTL